MWTINDGIAALKKKGAKITAQRIAILRHLEGRTDHPSADTLYRELAQEYPTMSVATVYSTAQLLADAGLIKILSIDEKRVYFDPTTDLHGHFLCRKCGKLIDIDVDESALLGPVYQHKDEISQIQQAEVFLYGLCTECFDD